MGALHGAGRLMHVVGVVHLLGCVCSQLAGAYYNLASEDGCAVIHGQGDRADILCRFNDSHSGHVCAVQRINWQQLTSRDVTNVSASRQYDVWQTIPGWGTSAHDHMSLLRIKRPTIDDIGRYRCRIECTDVEGSLRVEYRSAEVCIAQPHSTYALCSKHADKTECAGAFWNGRCDRHCDNEADLYDGFDCDPARRARCEAAAEVFCARRYADGTCNRRCDSAGCAWDGGDCIIEPRRFATNMIVLTPTRQHMLATTTANITRLKRSLSQLLRAVVQIIPDRWGGDRTTEGTNVTARSIHAKIDNTNCKKRCFRSAHTAAKFISLALQNGWDPGVPLRTVAALEPAKNVCLRENNSMLHIDLDSLDDEQTDGPADARPRDAGAAKTRSRTPIYIAVGSTCAAILVIVVVFALFRYRRAKAARRADRRRADIYRIHSKHAGNGTNV